MSKTDRQRHCAAEAGGADPKLRSTNQEVAQLLEQVAALGEDAGEADLTPPSNHAPQRFAAAVKAAVAADAGVNAADVKYDCISACCHYIEPLGVLNVLGVVDLGFVFG